MDQRKRALHQIESGIFDDFAEMFVNSKPFMLEAVSLNAQSFQIASSELKRDPQLIMYATAHGYTPTSEQYDIAVEYAEPIILLRDEMGKPKTHHSKHPRVETESYHHLLSHHGPHFATIFKRKMGDYAGIATSDQDYQNALMFMEKYNAKKRQEEKYHSTYKRVQTERNDARIRSAVDRMAECPGPGCSISGGKKTRRTFRSRRRIQHR